MNVIEVMAELESLGSAQTRKTYTRHGAPPDALFGVKVGDMKKILKKIRKDQQLALDLYDTANADAQYLAGLAADGSRMTKTQLNAWAKQATWYMVSEYAVPGVASEHPEAPALADKWIRSRTEHIAACGWATWAAVTATRGDDHLDLDRLRTLLELIAEGIHSAKNRVRYAMNGFVISVGTYVEPLLADAKATAETIGKVHVEMGETACKVPLATEYISKVEKMGRVGKKRKTAKC